MDKLLRYFRIITLIQGKPGILARELAERCETTERTIYRDLEALSSFVPFTNNGHGKGYTFIGNYSLYPLDWDEKEAMAFSMLPSVLEQVKPILPPGFDSAYEKVMASHQKEKSRRREIAEEVVDVIQMGSPQYRENTTDFLYPIIQAIQTKHSIECIYHTQSRNESSKRKIDPYCLVPRENRFYVAGFCHQKGEIRTFRLSRFREVAVSNDNFDKGDFNIHHYLKNTWSIERGNQLIHFKIKFSPQIARYVKEEEFFVKPKMTDLKDGSLFFEVTINHDREFLGWLSQYGPDAEIIEPTFYRREMFEKLNQWLNVYSRSVEHSFADG